MALFLLFVFSFFAGALPVCYWIGLSKGINILQSGSRNGGSTNLKRRLRDENVPGAKRLGTLGFLLDVAKGSLCTGLGWYMTGLPWVGALAGLAAALGHSLSPIIWVTTKRVRLTGRGIAALFGLLLVLHPLLALAAFFIWKVRLKLTGYVSRASITACAFVSLEQLLFGWHEDPRERVILILLPLLDILYHRSNWARLKLGLEAVEGVEEEVSDPKSPEPFDVLGGFTVNPTKPDHELTKARLLEKLDQKLAGKPGFIRGPLLALLRSFSPSFVHHHLLRWLPADLMKMGHIYFVSHDGIRVKVNVRACAVVPDRPKAPNRYWIGRSPEAWVGEQVMRLAEEGARIVTLGSDTTMAGGYGEPLAPVLNARKRKVGVSTGNITTAVTGVDALVQTATRLGYDVRTAPILVIGAAGSTGRVALRRLLEVYGCQNVSVAGRTWDSTLKLCEHSAFLTCRPVKLTVQCLGTDPETGREVEKDILVPRAKDIVAEHMLFLTVSSSGDLGLAGCWFTPGSVVCDIARPRNVAESLKGYQQVLVIDGGIVELPNGGSVSFKQGLAKNHIFGCQTEECLLLLKWYRTGFDPNWPYLNFSLGKELDYERSLLVPQWLDEEGFRVVGARSFDEELSDDFLNQFAAKWVRPLAPAAAP